MSDREIRERLERGKPVTEAHRHFIEIKYQGLALHEVACEGLAKADRYGKYARVCGCCGDVYHEDDGFILDERFCSRDCYERG